MAKPLKPLMGLIPAIMSGNAAVGFGQLEAQLIGCATLDRVGFWFLLHLLQDSGFAVMGLRVSPEDEIAGLDMPEMGVLAYPTFPTETAFDNAHTNGNGAIAPGQVAGQPV